jgi:hypothetical protein
MNTLTSSRAVLSPVAAAAGLAAALVALFVLCALVQAVAPGWPAIHAWIGLFTAEPTLSLRAWVDGILWSTVFGGVAGAVFVAVYNAVLSRSARVGPRCPSDPGARPHAA